jgi:hypothetical protein
MAWGKPLNCAHINFTFSGCFSRHGVGPLVKIDGIMDAPIYRDILAENMLPYAHDRMPPDWRFQQDGDSKHRASLLTGKRENLNRGLLLRIKIGWFAANDVNVLQTPAYSPDTNPIENLWHIVKLKLKGRRFKTKDELWSEVMKAWNEILPVSTCMKLVDSMPRRMQAIIRAKGWNTKY